MGSCDSYSLHLNSPLYDIIEICICSVFLHADWNKYFKMFNLVTIFYTIFFIRKIKVTHSKFIKWLTISSGAWVENQRGSAQSRVPESGEN
jgi:hypothetical protein